MKRQIKLKKIALSISIIAGIVLSQGVFAEIKPKDTLTDERIKQVEFQKNNVVTIVGKPFVSTQIIFGEDESILDVQGGDEAGWTVHIDKTLPNILTIKPTLFDSNTNLAVVTNDKSNEKRIYHFHLLMGAANQANNTKATYAIEFMYPDKEKAKLEATLNFLQRQKESILNASKKPSDYHWDYSFNGNKTIMPLHVFDDGQFTYLQLRPHQTVPSVFAVDNKEGEESVVNTRIEGDYLVIQQTAPQFTLREGSHKVATVFNDTAIEKIRNNGE
ncbi:MAG: TrbG/VirB9 family P-type conjugative transfer protein [Gammaproteobacteria bacterium]|nr:TrbG/VirB9 family P-type conjugative transfer protein [Gammaproteobacteria bacterium]MCD8542244.1 TrbG/VirB9 family P-type conjugative transfer protein [Gammaproteobacteria bacterium]